MSETKPIKPEAKHKNQHKRGQSMSNPHMYSNNHYNILFKFEYFNSLLFS